VRDSWPIKWIPVFFYFHFLLELLLSLQIIAAYFKFSNLLSLLSQVAAFLHTFVKKTKVGWCGRELAFQTVRYLLLIY